MNTVSITCATAECGYSPFPMEEGFNKRARRSHETFYCPAGHDNYYPQESDLERLERLYKTWKQDAEWWQESWQRAIDLAHTCPWPTCREYAYSSRSGLYDHMRRIHDMPTLALVQDAS